MSEPTQPPFSANQTQNITAPSAHLSGGSYMPVIMVLSLIALISVLSCVLGHICSRRRKGHVLHDLEKGLDMVKADATIMKSKVAASSKIKPEVKTTTAMCELHCNKIDPKKLFSTKATDSIMPKKQTLNRCELHGGTCRIPT